MIKLELTVDQVDYDRLAELLVPRVKESRTFGHLLPGMVTVELVKRWLDTMPQEKKEQITVELLNANRQKLIEKAETALNEHEMPVRIADAKATLIR